MLEAFSRFAVQLHEQGIEHRDFNHGNVLWRRDAATGAVRFQLIDINRMRFADRPLRPRVCMVNLRRLSCPAVAFLFILDRYAEARGWNVDDTLLQGTFFRLAFGRQARELEQAGSGTANADFCKKRLRRLVFRIISLHLPMIKDHRDHESIRFCILFLLLFLL